MKNLRKIDDQYFQWLLKNIDGTGNERYGQVLLELHRRQFYSLVPNDDNRAVDGLKLREMFGLEMGVRAEELLVGPCSVLEMLIALASRMDHILYDYEFDDRTSEWFWMLVSNLNLMPLDETKRTWRYIKMRNENAVSKFLNRKYDENGVGGLFPLRNPKKDQRDVEIWYQMSAYIQEMKE